MPERKTQLLTELNVKKTSTYDLDLFVFQATGIIFLFLTGFNQGAQLQKSQAREPGSWNETALTPADDLGSESTNAWYKSQLRLSQLSSLLTSKMARLLVSSFSIYISFAQTENNLQELPKDTEESQKTSIRLLLLFSPACSSLPRQFRSTRQLFLVDGTTMEMWLGEHLFYS